MGAVFGYIPNNGINLYFKPSVTPHPLHEPENDPLDGFPDREKRSVRATLDELISAKIPLKDRDYCSDFLLKFRACRKEKWPFPVFCQHEKHAYLNCQYEDFVLRMKEYERERRMKERGLLVYEEECDEDDDEEEIEGEEEGKEH